MQELEEYDARQRQLEQQLLQQERLIQAVDNDIEKRQTLLNYVFQEHHSSQTSSLIQSEITGTTANQFSPDGTYRNLARMNR